MLRAAINKRKMKWLRSVEKGSNQKVKTYMMNEYKRWLARNDMFYLALITGHDKINNWKEFYRPYCDEISLQCWSVVKYGLHEASEGMLPIEEVAKELPLQRMYLCYRSFYKTTMVSKLKALQLLLNFHNLHFVLCHNKQENASDNLVTVKNYFLSKPVWSKEVKERLLKDYAINVPKSIKELFPECVPSGKEWGNMTGFSLANRTDMNRTEDNIEAAGVDTEVTGRHWQLAIKNDLVTEKSVTTEDQIKKTLDWDERFNQGLFDDNQTPLQDYEGTRYHYADMYSVKKNDSRIKLTEISIVKDLEKFKAGDEDQVTHPDRYNREGIEDLMKNPWVFMCQQMMKPEDPSRMQFNNLMIQYYESIPEGCFNYLLVDPASARKKKSDYTVALVIAVIQLGNKFCKFVRDGVRDKLDAKQRIDVVIDLATRHKVKSIAWEAIGFQDTDCFNFEEERRKRKLRVDVEPIKSHVGSKEDRIRGLVPEYANGEWYWPEKGKIVKTSTFDGKSYDLSEVMEHEMLQFPLGEHDDLIDAMTFLNRLDVSRPKPVEVVEDAKGMTFGDYHDYIDENKTQRNQRTFSRSAFV